MDRKPLIDRLRADARKIAPGQPVHVSLFEPADALGVSLCYYEIYGAAFPIEHVYDPDEVARRNATEDQYTAVARTPKGEIVGLAGLFRHAPNPAVYECGQLMVTRPYRGGTVSRDLVRMVLRDLPEELGMQAVFGEAVCNHVVSQRYSFDYGHFPTGLELECMPAGAYSKENELRRNVSLLLTFGVKKDRFHTVHLPRPYAGVVKGLYKELGLARSNSRGAEAGGLTSAEVLSLPDARFSRVTVTKAGADFEDVVARAQAEAGDNARVQVYVNLGDPAAPSAIDRLRGRGFFFGGLLPLWFGADGLVMQHLPEPPAWDELQLHGEPATRLAAYIRQDCENAHRSG